jgi:hypothetical protein
MNEIGGIDIGESLVEFAYHGKVALHSASLQSTRGLFVDWWG